MSACSFVNRDKCLYKHDKQKHLSVTITSERRLSEQKDVRVCPLISFQDELRDGKACMVSIPVRVIRCGYSEVGVGVKTVAVQYWYKWYRVCGVPYSVFNGERRV